MLFSFWVLLFRVVFFGRRLIVASAATGAATGATSGAIGVTNGIGGVVGGIVVLAGMALGALLV